VTVRVRFANLNSVTRSLTLDAPISATVILAELAEELVRAVIAEHPDAKTIRFWRSLCRISKSTGISSWNFRLDFKMNLVAPAPKQAWHGGRPTVPSTKSAIASDGMPLGTARWCWASLVPFPTSFASLPKRTCDRQGQG
jgi:hypothetical protein